MFMRKLFFTFFSILFISSGYSQGLDCSDPAPAVEGLNIAPSAPYWYTYTAPRDELITVTSHPSTVDTFLEIISDCSYTEIFISNDFIDAGFNAAYGTVLLSAGQTIYINWSDVNSSAGFEWYLYTEPEIDLLSASWFPVNNAVDVSIDVNNFVLPFKKAVDPGFGSIVLKKSSDGSIVTSTFNKESVDNNLVLSASIILEPNTSYFFEVNSSAASDSGATEFWNSTGLPLPFPNPTLLNIAGISDPSVWTFTTGTTDANAPVLLSTSPNSNISPNTKVGLNLEVELVPSEPITYSDPAFIEVYRKLDDALVANVDLVQNGRIISGAGTRLLVDISGSLSPSTEYYINIPPNTIFDLSGKALDPILDDITWLFTTAEPTITSDSLALVDIYNGLEGGRLEATWLNDMVETWEGVTTVGGKVKEINLAGQQLRGVIPATIGNLDQITNLYLNDNSFSDLPDLSVLPLLDTLNVTSNILEFDDIEPLIGNYNELQYAPQTSYLNINARYLTIGESQTLSAATVAGNSITTAWYLNDVLIPGETNNSLTISNFQLSNSGSYTARASSALVPGLEIQTASVMLYADTTTTGNTSLFEWVTSGAIIDDKADATTYGSNWVDMDNDGDDDLMLTHWLGQPNYADFIYENLGGGDFQKINTGLISEVYSQRFVSWGDFNNDELPDLVYTLTSNTNTIKTVILQNDGNFIFTELPQLNSEVQPHGTIWAELNNDGNLDLVRSGFLFNEPVLEFFMGDGQGNFVSNGQQFNAYSQYNIQNIDFDNDGDTDIYLADHGTSDGRPMLYVNDGSGQFEERSLLDIDNTWSGSWGDIENDGDMDLFFMNRNFPEGYFLINDGAGNLNPVAMETIVGEALNGRGSAFIDVDNNGYADLVASDRANNAVAIYLNNAGTFTKYPGPQQIFQPNTGFSGLSAADYDDDGFIDLMNQNFYVFSLNGTSALYRNRGNSNNWLKVDLEGALSNKEGIGARIVVNSGSLSMTRQVQVLTSFASSNSKTAHFGLANNATADITVYWPSGLIQNVSGVSANQRITIDEAAVASEKVALIALYNATDGPNWTDNTNWNTSAPLDQWFGVLVNDSNRVERLFLGNNNLNGVVPAEIGNLTELKYLQLGSNAGLIGSIPAEIGQLQKLDTLGFSYSSISGPIPAEIYSLSNLSRLSMSNCQLTGEISPSISNMTSLRHIALWNTLLTGTIPEEFWDMNWLERIYLGTTAIGGEISPKIGEFANLDEFWISESNLSGTIPSEIGNAVTTTLINLYDNNLSGSVPDEIANLKNLKTLGIQNNNLDRLPDLNSIDSLQTLSISNNKFTYADIIPNQNLITENTSQKPFGDSTQVQAYTFKGLRLDPTLEIIEEQQYQWFKDGSPLFDGTGHYYEISDFREDDGGVYTLEVIHPDVPAITLTRNPINVFVNEGDPPKPQAVEVISPNGDGINDEMTIKNIELYPEHRILIYDVLGRLVYETSDYDNINNPFIGIGNVNGYTDLPSGTYYYLIDVKDNKKNGTGYFIMKRR